MLRKKLEKGELSIFDDVIKIITGMAITEQDGVAVSTTSIKGKLLEKVKPVSNSIKINTMNEKIVIDVKVAITYGKDIPKAMQELQNLIKNHVELFTGFTVQKVNVIVNQIIIED
ncbi:Asp23/Gls24 family envelope stress response protein [Anaerobacillus isosaccharinicus]|uniref:Asp23/Gls24 family envelope stress response protein n=1 Tax=Anaerobacillus isosaccharinicus TaxID=1532552 RepID=A0A1S2M762_9BACI|nr:Asp23/Gls24 family envelope stress response protein [Anaerobacillus isosaccharinicus]MBA5587476.1 Asp23/Gls24 family envelope stress response protein [Anaerobacillus isosaccharinicus]QOY34341.1 Asp23/Gls24 family envelope stress response protein [Anaerobacillus isosaccharinicus]